MKKLSLSKEQFPLVFIITFMLLIFIVLGSAVFLSVFLKGDNFLNKVASYGPNLKGLHSIASRPSWSMAEMMDGSWQKKFENWISEKIPGRKLFIRSYNQVLHTVFDKSYMYQGNLLVGKNQYLYEVLYVSEYCNPNQQEYSDKASQEWIQNLASIQAFFEARGQKFFYLITPSKATYMPENLPENFQCYQNQTRPKYYKSIAELKNSQIPFIDGSALMVENKATYPDLLFPRGGTHWTTLGAALTLQELMKTVYASKPEKAAIQFSHAIAHEAKGEDKDILDLANLLFPDTHYQVPRVSVVPVAQQNTESVAVVGGSFCQAITKLMAKAHVFHQVDYYYYYSIGHFRYTQGQTKQEIIDPATQDNFDQLLKAEVVILEENEANLNSHHTKLLLQKIASLSKK